MEEFVGDAHPERFDPGPRRLWQVEARDCAGHLVGDQRSRPLPEPADGRAGLPALQPLREAGDLGGDHHVRSRHGGCDIRTLRTADLLEAAQVHVRAATDVHRPGHGEVDHDEGLVGRAHGEVPGAYEDSSRNRHDSELALVQGGAEVSERQLGWTMGIAIAVFAAVFIAAPALATKLGGHAIGVNSSLGQNLIEGGIRLGLFLGYITLISLIPDIRRVYQYHGAEHKTIAAYENGDPLEPEVVDRYSTLHVRCGTNFLFIVLFLTVLVGLVLDFLLPHVVLLRVAARILVIPLLAAFGYEIIRAASRDEHSLAFRVASLPGLALQKITTRAPDRDQIEVAIRALEAVIAAEALAAGVGGPEGRLAPEPN